MKLVDVDPGPSANIDKDAAVKHNNKRFFRSFALVIGTFAVTLGATYYVPNIIFEMFKVKVPVWYLLNQEVFVTGVVATALAWLTCFYAERATVQEPGRVRRESVVTARGNHTSRA